MKLFLLTFILCFSLSASAFAQQDAVKIEPPNDIDEYINIERDKRFYKDGDEDEPLPLNIKADAQKEAALSYGARGGLAWRTWHIRNEMETRARYLDKVFDFRQLLIPASSGLLIEPPVISEAMDAMIIDRKGLEAAVADRVLNIGQNARIVSAPRTWRSYLERQWGDVEPPPDILRPVDKEERKIWEENIREGWKLGVDQADEIFQADLNKLVADYQGMVRYRNLLAQGMVSPPYALQIDRGITGGGDEMRIGDRGLSLTELPKLQTGSKEWRSVNR